MTKINIKKSIYQMTCIQGPSGSVLVRLRLFEEYAEKNQSHQRIKIGK